MTTYKAISFGLGPIGASIAKLALKRNKEIEIIGAVDVNPSFVGKDLSEVIGLGSSTGIKVRNSASQIYPQADVLLHATSSFLSVAKGQFAEFCENKVDVVSTCEELSFPWYNHREIASELDALAKKHGVTLLGTGVNPGFVMDALPITLSGACASVTSLKVTRVLDAAKRRLPFQKKVGIGLSVGEFEENVRTGKFGHIGLPESMSMICSSLGLDVDRIDQKVSPKIATEEVNTQHFGLVSKGKVIGLVQDGYAFSRGRQLATFHIEMYAGAKDPRDEIVIEGEPNISLVIPGGTPGDIATAAVVVNSLPRVVDAKPGLLTVKELRPASSVFSR